MNIITNTSYILIYLGVSFILSGTFIYKSALYFDNTGKTHLE